MMVSRLLVPVDFSGVSTQTLQCAAILARAFGASIELLHVYEPPDVMSGIVAGADAAQDLEAERVAAVARMAKLIRETPFLEGIPLTSSAEVGYAASTILAQARAHRIDLIVMGTHGRTGLNRWIMGSVAQGVMNGARCPALILHEPPLPADHGTTR